jgi:hypothetical protein
LDKKPFVKVGNAGSVRMIGNTTSDRQLLDARDILGGLEVSDNKVLLSSEASDQSKFFSGWRGWVMSIVGGLIVAAIAYCLGFV